MLAGSSGEFGCFLTPVIFFIFLAVRMLKALPLLSNAKLGLQKYLK
jgi:hypothetical protein